MAFGIAEKLQQEICTKRALRTDVPRSEDAAAASSVVSDLIILPSLCLWCVLPGFLVFFRPLPSKFAVNPQDAAPSLSVAMLSMTFVAQLPITTSVLTPETYPSTSRMCRTMQQLLFLPSVICKISVNAK